MELRGSSVAEDLGALEAAASKNTHIVAVACRLETSEAAVDAFLGHHLDWRWDVGAVYQRDGPCPRVELRIQPPKLAAVLRRFWQQQFNSTCDRVVVVSRHSGTYLGNRMFSMARAFIHTAMKHKLPYRFEGVPNFLLDDAACGPGGHQNAFYKDMECFWLPQTSCKRPRVGPDDALGEGECARAAPGPWDWRKETNWTCERYYVDPSAKRRGVRRFPRTLNPGHGEAHFMIAFAAIAMRPTGQEKGDSTSLQYECFARARSRKSIHASRALREMIARPKISRNEWKSAEKGAFEIENFAPFSCPGSRRCSACSTWSGRARWTRRTRRCS